MRSADAIPTRRRLFACFFWIGVAAVFINSTVDADMWRHLAYGRLIAGGTIPTRDMFSFTCQNHPLVPEVFFQFFLWKIYEWAGLAGMMAVPVVFSTFTLWLVHETCEGKNYLALYVVLMILGFYGKAAWAPRPYLFSYFFTALFILILEKVRFGKISSKWLYALPFLMALWSNFHTAYVFGIFIVVVYALGEWLHGRFWPEKSGLDGIGRKMFFPALAGCVALSFLNFSAIDRFLLPLTYGGGNPQINFIIELQSPEFHHWLNGNIGFLFMLGTMVLAWTFDSKKPDFIEIMLFFSTAFMSFFSIRHFPFFAIVNAPALSRHLLGVLENTPYYEYCKGRNNTALKEKIGFPLAMVLVALVGFCGLFYYRMAGNDREISKKYPVAAVDYALKAHLDKIRIFNDYSWGEYLLWRGVPVFIDARGELYKKEIISAYMDTVNGLARWKSVLKRYRIECLFISRSCALASLAGQSPEWRLVYADKLTRIFVHRAEKGTQW